MSAPDVVETYLAQLDAALADLHEPERAELVADVRAYLCDAVASGTAAESAVASLGDAEALARRMIGCGAEDEPHRVAPDDAKRFLGVPYNFGPMSAEQVASRLWNTSDPRILMPRVFGVGWTLNFGAIAVRLGLVRPDDEEPVPFAAVPEPALSAGLAVVTVVNAAAVVAALMFRELPRPVPVHWGFSGPDQFAAPATAALSFLGPPVALTAVALFRAFSRRASRTERALSVAGLALATTMFVGMWVDAVSWASSGVEPYAAGWAALAGVVAVFVVLFAYSRLGVRAEWRRARVR